MSKIRLFTDEDVYRAVAQQLRAYGFDVVSTVETQRRGETDESQLSWAAQHDRVFFTFNVADFPRMHHEWLATGKHHTGLIVSRQRQIGDILRRLLHLSENVSHEAMTDRLVYLSNW